MTEIKRDYSERYEDDFSLGRLPMIIGQKNNHRALEESLEALWSEPDMIELAKSITSKPVPKTQTESKKSNTILF